MKLHDAITSGVDHIFQNRLRAGLSILGILIGVASVLCMMAIGDGANQLIADDLERMGGPNQFQFTIRYRINRHGRLLWTKERYNLGDALAIEEQCPKVLFVLPKNERWNRLFTSPQGNQTRSILESVTEQYADGMQWKVQSGRFLSENDLATATQVCVLGTQVAIDLFGEDSPLGQEIKIRYYWRNAVRCRVIGVMAPRGRTLRTGWSLDDVVCIPLTTYQQRISGNDYIERLTVFTEEDANMARVIEIARNIIRKRHRNTDDFIYHWTAVATVERMEHIEKVIKIALGSIAGFSLFVSGISIMNICLVSVSEKAREIGLRKSVGAKRRDIFWQFLTESVCLCLCSGLLGIGFGYFAAYGMALLAVKIVPVVPKWPVVVSVSWMLGSVFFSMVMGVGFGLYPAMRATQLSPIDALRADT